MIIIATATRTGWNLYRQGSNLSFANVAKLETARNLARTLQAELTVVMGGQAIN